MEKYYVNPRRVREVWARNSVAWCPYFLEFFFNDKVVVYWDVGTCTGMLWPLDQDRTTEPRFTTRFKLKESGYKLEETV